MQSVNTPINKVLTQAATDPPPEVRSLSQLLEGSRPGHISCGSADELLLGLALAVQLTYFLATRYPNSSYSITVKLYNCMHDFR